MTIPNPRSTGTIFPIAPLSWTDMVEHIRKLGRIINGLLDGHHNATGTVTLTASATSTTLADVRIGRTSNVHLDPTTANAAAALGTTYRTHPNATEGQAVINHANNAQTDRTFRYTIQG